MKRGLGGLIVLAAAAWALVVVFSEPVVEAEPVVWTSSEQCIACHAEVGAEWRESWHAQSWTDPLPRAPDQSNDFSNTDCIDCHAPRPIFETGIGERVLPRAVRRVEGVDCIACHLLPDGRVAGTIDNPSAPCRPKAMRDLRRAEYCAGCHNQHGTVDQWSESSWGAQNVSCIDCHMVEVTRADGSTGRDHRSFGGHSLDFLQAAVTVSATVGADGWVARVENTGAGHNYPTDERSRASDLFWRRPGETEWKHLYRFRNPYRFEVGLPNTELPSGEAVEVDVADAAPDEAIEIALFYKLTPVWDDPENPDPETDSTATLVFKDTFTP